VDIHADNAQDASQKFQTMRQNPHMKNLMANSNVNAKVHLKNEHIERLRETSVSFSKKEIKEMLNS
jgi:hypothetical protein